MSGHSKWSKVKHQKEASDAAKSREFTKLSNAITIAVREGGGSTDPDSNFRLRLAIEKARNFNMPKDKIERAISRARIAGEKDVLEKKIYEAFVPGGIGLIIETASSNKQRTVAELKNILERGGGILASTGAVSHMFKYVGVIHIKRGEKSYDDIFERALESGAVDLKDLGESIDVFTEPSDLHKVKESLENWKFLISSFELIYRPITLINISDPKISEQIIKLLSNLHELEDVQKVYSNLGQ